MSIKDFCIKTMVVMVCINLTIVVLINEINSLLINNVTRYIHVDSKHKYNCVSGDEYYFDNMKGSWRKL